MKVTADTITESQIRQLRSELCEFDATGGRDTRDVEACSLALMRRRDPDGMRRRCEARARCAAAWNARHGGDS